MLCVGFCFPGERQTLRAPAPEREGCYKSALGDELRSWAQARPRPQGLLKGPRPAPDSELEAWLPGMDPVASTGSPWVSVCIWYVGAQARLPLGPTWQRGHAPRV